MVISKKIQNFN